MTTNRPGTVTQQPLYGCTSCYEDVSYPAVDLRVYDNECWCEECWDNASYEVSDGIDWTDLAPFKPALQAECDQLRKDADRIDWLADPNNSIGNVQLPMVIVRQHLHSLRDAIDAAMQEPNHD